MPEAGLSGRRVLVCRPEQRAASLLDALHAAGAEAVLAPVLVLHPLEPAATDRELVQRLGEFEVVVVVSPLAARLGIELLEQWWPQWPQHQQWLAVGTATATVLRDAGLPVAAPPENQQHSEGLLSLPALRNARRVLLLRGRGGRELLRNTLTENGASVEELVLYERRPALDMGIRLPAELTSGRVDALIALSVDTLEALCTLAGSEQKQLEWMPVVVSGERVAERAAGLGFRRVLIAGGVRDQDLIAALHRHFDEHA